MNVEIRQLKLELAIDAPLERVWTALIDEIGTWWPRDFMSIPDSEKIILEPWPGGRLYEQSSDGRGILWSNVVMVLPNDSIEFVGYMTPTYAGPSITMIRLSVKPNPEGGTIFRMSDAVMGRIDDEQEQNLNEGWAYLFGAFKNYCEARA
jgi:uncharacterized protein YndB with AHSA1/START domain